MKNTAMMRMATRSSSTASASRNTRSRFGSPRPKTASTPSAKAMSVAVGIGQPSANGVPRGQRQVDASAGTTTPATAAMAGWMAFCERVQLAGDQLVLELDGDDEEEDREESVADPVPDAQLQRARYRGSACWSSSSAGPARGVGQQEAERGGARAGGRRRCVRNG